MREGFDAVMNGVIENMHQHGMPQAGVDEIRAAIGKWYDTEINFDDIRPKMVDLYVKEFSEDDLKQILAFYQSPIGQKTIKNLPGVMREGAVIAQEYTKAKIPSLNAQLMPILTKYRDQMEAGRRGRTAEPDARCSPPGNRVPSRHFVRPFRQSGDRPSTGRSRQCPAMPRRMKMPPSPASSSPGTLRRERPATTSAAPPRIEP